MLNGRAGAFKTLQSGFDSRLRHGWFGAHSSKSFVGPVVVLTIQPIPLSHWFNMGVAQPQGQSKGCLGMPTPLASEVRYGSLNPRSSDVRSGFISLSILSAITTETLK